MGQFNIAPVLDFDLDSNLDTPYDYKNKEASTPTVEVDRTFNPFEESNNRQIPGCYMLLNLKKTTDNWDSLYVG